MAKFVLADGEQKMSEFEVSLVDGRSSSAARLVLTNTRLVVLTGIRTSFAMRWFLGLYALAVRGITAQMASRVTYEIPRERFASVEPGEGNVIVFHNDGDGYAHISFAIVKDAMLNQESFEVWQQRMHAWASHSVPAAPLPSAKLVR